MNTNDPNVNSNMNPNMNPVMVGTVPTTNPVPTMVSTVPVMVPNTSPVMTAPAEPVMNPMPSTSPIVSREAQAMINPVTQPVSTAPATTPVSTTPPTETNSNTTSGGKRGTIGVILLFAFLIGFIVFLPNVSDMVDKYLSGDYKTEKTVITSGTLYCVLDSSTAEFDKVYDFSFAFSNSKLTAIDFTTTTKSDLSSKDDEAKLKELLATCKQLMQYTESMSGVTVLCNSSKGKVTVKQSFELEELDMNVFDAAYTEMDGFYPEYRYGESIDTIEKQMNASGYTCTRTS